MSPTRVLVLDDDPPSRLLLRHLLEHRGWEVLEAEDADEAVRLLDGAPALFLLDEDVPGGGGARVLREIRRRPGLTARPVAAVTAHAMPGDRDRLLELGFDAYFSKPIDARRIVDDLERLLADRVGS